MRVLVVGGSKGLGASIASALSSHEVLSVSRTSEPVLDLGAPDIEIRRSVREVADRLGGLDAVVVSGGQGAYLAPLAPAEEIERLFKVNTLGPISVYRGALKSLLKSKGKFVVVTSTAARRPGSGGLSIYAASKGALNSWVISEGRRFAKHGGAICAVSPGWFQSEMTAEIKPEIAAANLKGIPFGAYGDVHEIAQFTAALLHQSNWCLAGQIFEVSGGG